MLSSQMVQHILQFNICWTFILFMKASNAEWLIDKESLPRADDEMAVGAYNDKIFIIGGYHYPQQLVEYDIITQTITDYGELFLSSEVGGESQFWTQQEHIVYIIQDTVPSTLAIFDMNTSEYTTNWSAITFTTDVGHTSCLASSDAFLYIVGGETNYDAINIVQILSLTTYSWLSNPPFMKDNREHHACIAHNHYLWAFGGSNNDRGSLAREVLATNERVQTTDITHNIWQYIDSFTIGLQYIGAAALQDTIYIIGGKSYSDDTDHKGVYLVDTNTGTIIKSADALPWVNLWGAPIIADNTLYVFGGFYINGGSTLIAEWAYYRIATSNPTAEPSQTPFVSTSSEPITSPTNEPTIAPSNKPTTAPSNEPTIAPSNEPSLYPLRQPNISTMTPSAYPIIAPSKQPTSTPDTNLTKTPTYLASKSPIEVYTFTTTIMNDVDNSVKESNNALSATHLAVILIMTSSAVIVVIVCMVKKYKKRNANKTTNAKRMKGNQQLGVTPNINELKSIYNVDAILNGSIKMTSGQKITNVENNCVDGEESGTDNSVNIVDEKEEGESAVDNKKNAVQHRSTEGMNNNDRVAVENGSDINTKGAMNV